MDPKIREKAWNPELESGMLKRWQDEGLYDFELKEENYTIDTPPPYPSGRPWHMGAAAHYSQIDMIARTARMSGKNVYFPIGIDRNGLPVELYTEKKHGIRMRDTPRDEFLHLCREALDDLESEMVQIMTLLGLSGGIEDRYHTDSAEYRALTQSTFIEMWRRGEIYLANRPNNYDWASGTTIADAEILYEDRPSKLVYMRFKIDGSDDFIPVASTRPELLCACACIIVGESDSRYQSMVGRDAVVPIFGKRVRIMTHHSAKEEFGSGAVMVCSYGDQNDVALFRELGLKETVAIGLDGRMTEAAGPYAGLRPGKAREKIIGDLEEGGFVTKSEDIMHRTPVSERSRTPIEIIPMEEYYVRQTGSVEDMRRAAKALKFHPPMHRQILLDWLDSISIDWPISRRRYYGTEIPVWRCKSCGEPHVPEPGGYRIPWKEEAPIKSCTRCGSAELVGEDRTFDTWMDSSVSALFVTRFGRDAKFFEGTYPAGLRPQAKDIVRTWLYYSALRCTRITGKLPWSEAWIMGYGLDEHGSKMSKSRGNAMDPLPIIQRLGADAFRFWSASEVTHGYDFRCSEQKIETAKKFLSKLWNVSRFISNFAPVESDDLEEADRWILYELDRLVAECRRGYAEYNFFVPAIAIREFTWNVFAPHYVEMVKKRAYGEPGFSRKERNAAISTLHRVLSAVLLLLAPITPFITDHLWRVLYSGESIHLQRHPEVTGMPEVDLGRDIIGFNSAVWNEKKARGLSLKEKIEYMVPKALEGMQKDLESMHNLVKS